MTVLYWLIVSVCTADLCITCRLLAATHILALVAVCLQEVSPQYRSVCVWFSCEIAIILQLSKVTATC